MTQPSPARRTLKWFSRRCTVCLTPLGAVSMPIIKGWVQIPDMLVFCGLACEDVFWYFFEGDHEDCEG